MIERIRHKPEKAGGKADYDVGRGRPPKHTQFRPGQSGNPAGRRKGLRNFRTDVRKALGIVVKIKEGGRTRSRSAQETALRILLQKMYQGDLRALDRLLELAVRFNTDPVETDTAQPLSADDEAILAAFIEGVSKTNPSVEPRPRRQRLPATPKRRSP
jgi:hypothetical protein